MKDSQSSSGPHLNWNGGVMSGSGGGGRREEGGRGGGGGGSGGYTHWPPHPLHSHHHHLQSQHSQLPRMMGSFFGGRGLPPAAAHFAGGGWGRSGGAGSGLKPPERWASVVGPSSQQAEGGMDLSQTRSNGSQPNGVAKEPVSVIAANPLRTTDKPLEPSDRSEDEDEDCMVIEEGEEAPRSGELPPSARQVAQTRAAEDSRVGASDGPRQATQMRPQTQDPSIGQEAPSLDLPPTAHHNPHRQSSSNSPGTTGLRSDHTRCETSHHLPPSVAQPLRSDSTSPLQTLQKPPSVSHHRGETSSPLQNLQKSTSLHASAVASHPQISEASLQLLAKSVTPESSHHMAVGMPSLQKPSSPHLPHSPLGQNPASPSFQAQQALHQLAQQLLVQKQMQDSKQQQMLAHQKLTESAYQHLLVQQKLSGSNQEASHQLLQQKLQSSLSQQLMFQQRQDMTALSQGQIPHPKSSEGSHHADHLHKPSSPASVTASQSQAKIQPVTLSRLKDSSSPGSNLREATGVGLSNHPQLPESHLAPTQDTRVTHQRHQQASLPPNLPVNIPSSLQVIAHPAGTSPPVIQLQASRQAVLEQKPDIASLPPQVQSVELKPAESADASSQPSLPPSTSPSLPHNPFSKSVEEASIQRIPQLIQPQLPQLQGNFAALSQGKFDAADTEPKTSLPEAVPVPTEKQIKSEPVREAPLPSSVDHVESMLENMFQQDETVPAQQPSTLNDERRFPALTDDKVVEILQDKEEEFVKTEIKEEIKTEMSTASGTPQKNNAFMQVESELEKMFAGIVETPGDSDKPETPESSKSSKKSMAVKRKARRPRTKKELDSGKKRRAKSPNAEALRLKKRFGPRADKIKEGSNDSSSISTGQIYKSRGPFIRVLKGEDGRPNSVTVVNSSSASAEEDRDRTLDKSLKRKAPRIVEGRTKGPGLYSSTLSSKYNSTTIDVTWTCIFCNRRSHCENGLGGEPAGDLFGPYLVHIKLEPTLGGPSDIDIVNEQRKRGGGKQLSLRAGGKANHSFSPPQKKRKLSVSDKESCDANGVVSKDVWVHEACAIWAPGVILVGPHLIGLDHAVSISLHSKCAVCGESGACISCLQHGCHKVCHYGCARATQWSLDEQTFHARCVNHKKPITMSLALHQTAV